MTFKTVKQIEEGREGLTEFLVYGINRYEEEFGMIVEKIPIDPETRELIIIDRLNSSSFGVTRKE